MTHALKNLRLAALAGFAAIAPFLLMELVNPRQYGEGLPFPLLWAQIVIAAWCARNFRTWLIDQWPCYLGVRFCDGMRVPPMRAATGRSGGLLD